jgi:hypothetical protein
MNQGPSRVVALIVILVAALSAGPALPEEIVAFNVETHKYHCLECRWALACTKNCVNIPLSEARRRGVPCKVCGGSCKGRGSHHLDPSPNPSLQRTTPGRSPGCVR